MNYHIRCSSKDNQYFDLLFQNGNIKEHGNKYVFLNPIQRCYVEPRGSSFNLSPKTGTYEYKIQEGKSQANITVTCNVPKFTELLDTSMSYYPKVQKYFGDVQSLKLVGTHRDSLLQLNASLKTNKSDEHALITLLRKVEL